MADIEVVEVEVQPAIAVVEVQVPGIQGPAGPDPWLGQVQTVTASTVTTEIDYSLGRHVVMALNADTALSVVEWDETGEVNRLTLEIHSSGTRAITWPGAVKWSGGTPPTLTGNGIDIIILTTTNAGAEIFGFAAGLDMS